MRISCLRWLNLCAFLAVTKIVTAETTTSHPLSDGFGPDKKIVFALGLIWEGETLNDLGINAIKSLRFKYPNVRIIHFISPAYFLKQEISAKAAVTVIKSVLSENDVVGLYLNAWRSLVESADVPFRTGPSFWGNQIDQNQCFRDCGREVALSAYSPTEVEKIIKRSTEIFRQNGFNSPHAFMVGGWMAAHHVLEVAAQHGLIYDFSAVPPQLVADQLRLFPLNTWLQNLWGGVSELAQPNLVFTRSGWITEMGNNGATVEYVNAARLFDLFRSHVKNLRESLKNEEFFHFAFYQETANQHLPRVESVLERMFAYTRELGVRLESFSPAHLHRSLEATSGTQEKGTEKNDIWDRRAFLAR